MIRIIETTELFLGIKEQWDSLYAELSYVTPFQSFSYNYNSWILLEKDTSLHIICLIRQVDNQLLAIFPCVLTKKGVLQYICGIHSDFCIPLIKEESRKDYHLYRELADYIKDTLTIKGFMFDNLKEGDCMMALMHYFFPGMQLRLSNKWSFLYVFAHDSEVNNFLESMKHLSPKERYAFKKKYKKMSNLTLRIYTKKNDEFPAESINEIINCMFSKGIRTEAYFSVSFLELIKKLYNDGILMVALSHENDKPMVANLYLIKGNEYINWLVVYKEGHYNTMNLLQSVNFIYEQGGGILNFARGIYEYKIRNFKPEIHNLYRIQYAKSFAGQLWVLLSIYKYYLKVMLKSIIKK